MPITKLNFISERLLTPTHKTCFHISLTKTGSLYFPKELIAAYDLDSAFLKVFVELDKKMIGYSIIKSADCLAGMTGLRKLHISPKTHSGLFQVAKILQSLGYKNESISKKIPYAFSKISGKYLIKKYDSTYLQDEVYYIDLNEKKIH